MLIGYNGDTLRDFISSTYRQVVNKDRRGRPLRRGRPKQSPENSNTTHHTEPATKLEYEMPKVDLVYLSNEEEYIDRYRPVTKLPVERVERISRPTRTQRYTVRIGSEHNFEPVREEGFQTGHFRDEGYQSGRIVEERFEAGLLPEYTWERRHRSDLRTIKCKYGSWILRGCGYDGCGFKLPFAHTISRRLAQL